MQNLEALRQKFTTPQQVVITTHYKPDADALGSSLAMANYLKKYKHNVRVIVPSDYPRFLEWMTGQEHVLVYGEDTHAEAAQLMATAQMLICLDFSSPGRAGDLEPMIRDAKAYKVMVDHHLEPERFADFMYSDTKAAATCELVFRLLSEMGEADKIDKAIAECLYAGLLTDTGSFRHPSTSSKVHLIVADLIEKGIAVSHIQKLIYDNYSANRLRFLGYVLYKKLTILPEYRTAYIAITQAEMTHFQHVTGDTEGFVNYALSIENIVVGAVFIDSGDLIKISFRSVGSFSVNKFARQHFEGGGHKNAAGGKSTLSLDATVEKFIQALTQQRQELLQSF